MPHRVLAFQTFGEATGFGALQDAALKRARKHTELQAKSTRLKAKLSSLLVLPSSCTAFTVATCSIWEFRCSFKRASAMYNDWSCHAYATSNHWNLMNNKPGMCIALMRGTVRKGVEIWSQRC